MTLKEYITILNKSVGEVTINTTPTKELNTITVEDKINSFDSKIIISHASMNTVKYGMSENAITVISSIKVPKSCTWAGVVKLGLNEDDTISVNINIITIGDKEIDVDSIMDDELKTLIKI